MTEATTTDEARSHQRSSPLAEILGVVIAIVVMGGLLSFDGTEASVRQSAVVVAPPPTPLDATGYEALRDAIAADGSLVPMVRSALEDGSVDVVEMDRIAPYAMRTPTPLSVDGARRDMLDTLEAMETRR